jgi:hypothetical protein
MPGLQQGTTSERYMRAFAASLAACSVQVKKPLTFNDIFRPGTALLGTKSCNRPSHVPMPLLLLPSVAVSGLWQVHSLTTARGNPGALQHLMFAANSFLLPA